MRGAGHQTLRVPYVPRSWGLCDQTAASACHSSIVLPLPFLRAGRSGVRHVRGARGHLGRGCCDLALGGPQCIPQTLATGGCRSVFLSCVRRNKMPATGCLQTAGVSRFYRLEVQSQGVRSAMFALRSPGEGRSLPLPVSGSFRCSLAEAALLRALPPSSHAVFCMHVLPKLPPFYKLISQ